MTSGHLRTEESEGVRSAISGIVYAEYPELTAGLRDVEDVGRGLQVVQMQFDVMNDICIRVFHAVEVLPEISPA